MADDLAEADELDDLVPSLRRGCTPCEVELTTARRYLDSLSYENVNDVGVRTTLRTARGFCNRHAWQFVDVARDSLGVAIIYRDIISTLILDMRGLADEGSRFRPLRLFRHAPGSVDLAIGQAIRRLQPQAICPTCEVVAVAMAERGHSGSGLCLPHLRLARAGWLEGADLTRSWAATVQRLRHRAVVSAATREHARTDTGTPGHGTLLDLAEAAFGKRGIQRIPRRRRLAHPVGEPSEQSIAELARCIVDGVCPVCRLVERDIAANVPIGASTFPHQLDALIQDGSRCTVHAWLTLAAAGGEVEARRHPLSRSAVDALAAAGTAASKAVACRVCDLQSRREAEYCLGLARLTSQRLAQPLRPGTTVAVPCLPHLLLLRELMPAESAVTVARGVLLVFQRLRQELTEYIRKQDYRFRDEPRGVEQTAPLRALALVAGARWTD